MRADEIREMGSDDITARIRELEEERFRLKFRSATEPLEDPLRLRVIRHDISRLHTILRERELAATRGESAAGTAAAAGAEKKTRGTRKTRLGVVVSDKMQKTVVVAIERRYPHPVYNKMVTRTKRVKAHDEENSAKSGDTVRIMETRPLSKDKRWRVVEIIERAR